MSYSFYVPRVHSSVNEQTVKTVIEQHYRIGTVTRVDFVPIDGTTHFNKAFIHMGEINQGSQYTNDIMTRVFNNNESVRINLMDGSSYWILLANKNPVAETTLNIHQLAENANILQALVLKQADEIAELKEMVAKLMAREGEAPANA